MNFTGLMIDVEHYGFLGQMPSVFCGSIPKDKVLWMRNAGVAGGFRDLLRFGEAVFNSMKTEDERQKIRSFDI